MCLALPMKILEIHGNVAECEAGGITQSIRTDFVEDAAVGDYVMVHAGFAIERMSEADAKENLDLLEEIRNAL